MSDEADAGDPRSVEIKVSDDAAARLKSVIEGYENPVAFLPVSPLLLLVVLVPAARFQANDQSPFKLSDQRF